MGPGADGFPAVGPATCESGGKNTHVVSLRPSRGTRTNPAASEAGFLTQLCGRTGGRTAAPSPGCPSEAFSGPARELSPRSCTETEGFKPAGGAQIFAKRRKKEKKKKFKQLGTTDRASVYERLQKGITVTLMMGKLYGGKCLQ